MGGMQGATELSFFENVCRNFDLAAVHTELPSGLLDQIKVCNSIYHFTFPLQTESGYETEERDRPSNRSFHQFDK